MATKLQVMQDFDLQGQWHNPPDEILSAGEAYRRRMEADQMMIVAWWETGDKLLPSGFSKFVFNSEQSIRLLDTPHPQSAPIAPDDVVLFWASRPNWIASDDDWFED